MAKPCSVTDCASPSDARGLCNKHWKRWRQYGTTEDRPKPTLEQRFWGRVTVTDEGSCWEWQGARSHAGYGKLVRDRHLVSTHRLSWEFATGHPVPDDLLVCHRCDNPPCVNPSHLFLGDKSANAIDMVMKGRHDTKSRIRGEEHARARLTDAVVADIRARHASDESVASIARSLGVNWGTVKYAVAGVTWAHIPLTASPAQTDVEQTADRS